MPTLEVDDEPGDVHERRDKGRGRSRGIEAEPLEQKRQERARQRAFEHDPDERDRDRQRDEQPVLAGISLRRRTRSQCARNPIVPKELPPSASPAPSLAPHHLPPVRDVSFASPSASAFTDDERGYRCEPELPPLRNDERHEKRRSTTRSRFSCSNAPSQSRSQHSPT